MPTTSFAAFFKGRASLLLVGASWFLVWLLPWHSLPAYNSLYAAFFIDFLKLALALIWYILPGAWLYLLLRGEGDALKDPLGALPVGFALSTALLLALGMIARLGGFSFRLVQWLFMGSSLLVLVLIFFHKPDFRFQWRHITAALFALGGNLPLLLALAAAFSVAFNPYLFFIDDTTYQAYALHWQNSPALGFENIVHYAPMVEHERFWLALYPLTQSLLAELSGVPVILLFGSYLELLLVPLAVITLYWFARVLGLSRKAAGVSALAQVFLYAWMVGEFWPVGFWFYINMAEDKVSAAFLLMPVFLFFALRFLQLPRRQTFAFLAISGVALVFTHPVFLFLSFAVAGGLALFSWWQKQSGWRELAWILLLAVALMSPYLFIRLYGHQSGAQIPFNAESAADTFQAERYINIISDRFYGLNPEVLKFFDIPASDGIFYRVFQGIRWLPFILAITAAVLAFFKRKEGVLYWYVMVATLLVVMAAIPYTGWILGLFLSARLISRVSWLSPLGLAVVILGAAIQPALQSSPLVSRASRWIQRHTRRFGRQFLPALLSIVFILVLLMMTLLQRSASVLAAADHYRQLAQVGEYIDAHTVERVTSISVDYGDTQLLPGVSHRSSLIAFREEKITNPHNYFIPLEEVLTRNREAGIIRSFDPQSAPQKCALLEKYQARYILSPRGVLNEFLTTTSECSERLSAVYETRDIILLEINAP